MYRIMLVEDDRELGETIKSLLTLKGYDVTLIGSVKEYNKHTEVYDMYLLDVKLPDGDGFQICEKIRHNLDAPIIFITSCDDEESIVKGLDIGGDDYVTKPFHNAVLLSRISANLRRSGMNDGDVYKRENLQYILINTSCTGLVMNLSFRTMNGICLRYLLKIREEL